MNQGRHTYLFIRKLFDYFLSHQSCISTDVPLQKKNTEILIQEAVATQSPFADAEIRGCTKSNWARAACSVKTHVGVVELTGGVHDGGVALRVGERAFDAGAAGKREGERLLELRSRAQDGVVDAVSTARGQVQTAQQRRSAHDEINVTVHPAVKQQGTRFSTCEAKYGEEQCTT